MNKYDMHDLRQMLPESFGAGPWMPVLADILLMAVRLCLQEMRISEGPDGDAARDGGMPL